MTRLAYYAPGVYVEEVPSARQPIAGVGTNTAGFIGIVPDVVYIPMPNSEYDPVLTSDLLAYAQLSAQGPRTDLLFDPQTGGGLLAAVPPDVAASCIAALHGKGISAMQIGRITAGPPGLVAR